ncbi:MAG: hypothetical protein VR68_00820 [Peptococcaceae bacterium BRH_c4a]|nr:MAG: hypothetical protein VR68_00820 [Peptococcaceae bacterium BRH_c4a]
MLKDVLKNTRQQLEVHYKTQNRVRDNNQFKINLAKGLGAASALDTTFDLLSEAKQQKVLHPSISPDVRNGLLTTISNLQGQLREGYLGDSDVREIWTLSATFKNEITAQWKMAATLKSEQVTSSLCLLGRFLKDPAQAAALVSKLDTGTQGLPVSVSQIKAFTQAVVQGQQMVDGAGFDDEIKTFLKKVTNNRATLTDITPKVQGWIQKQNLEGRIKVSFF